MASVFFRSRSLVLFSAVAWPCLVHGAPGPRASQPGLSFDVSAQFQVPNSGTGVQNVSAKVLVSGKKARVETGTGRARTLLIYSPPTVARLLPAAKAGVRWQIKTQRADFQNFDAQQLLREPGKIRQALLQQGAKKVGNGVINGTPVEIYATQKSSSKAANSKSASESAKVWLRRSDALPLRLEAKSRGVNVVATWKNYTRLKTVSPAQFQIPAGFKVRALQSAPPLAGL